MEQEMRELIDRMRAAVKWDKGISPLVVAGWANEFEAALAASQPSGSLREAEGFAVRLIERMVDSMSGVLQHGDSLFDAGVLADAKQDLAAAQGYLEELKFRAAPATLATHESNLLPLSRRKRKKAVKP